MGKKIISLVLAVILLVAGTTTAFGQEMTELPNAEKISVHEWVMQETRTEKIILKTEDYPNGDACTYLIKNGEIIYVSYLDRDANRIIDNDYVAKEISVQNVVDNINNYTLDDMSSMFTAQQATDDDYYYVSVGTIPYTITRTTQGETYSRHPELEVERSIDSGTTQRDLYGKYKNVANFVSFAASLLAIPVGVASPIVSKILSDLGLTLTAINFAVPTYYVRSAYTTITWHGVGGALTAVVQGSKYDMTFPDRSTKTEYEGNYYPSNSIQRKNSDLALRLGKLYYPGFVITVRW